MLLQKKNAGVGKELESKGGKSKVSKVVWEMLNFTHLQRRMSKLRLTDSGRDTRKGVPDDTQRESIGQGKPSFVFPKGTTKEKTQIGRNKTNFKHLTGLTELMHERAGREWGSLVPPNEAGKGSTPSQMLSRGGKRKRYR